MSKPKFNFPKPHPERYTKEYLLPYIPEINLDVNLIMGDEHFENLLELKPVPGLKVLSLVEAEIFYRHCKDPLLDQKGFGVLRENGYCLVVSQEEYQVLVKFS